MTHFRVFPLLFSILVCRHTCVSTPYSHCINKCGPGHPECPKETRCVYSGCSYMCLQVAEQDSRCPPSDSYGFCTDLCSHVENKGCHDGFLCCFNGCGNYCHDPNNETR